MRTPRRAGTLIGLAVACAAGASAAEVPPWRHTIQIPAGWTDASEEIRKNEDTQQQRNKLGAQARTELWMYLSENNEEMLQVTEVITEWKEGDPDAALRGWEAGARRSFAEFAKEISYERQDLEKLMRVDAVSELAGKKLYARRLVGFDAGHIVSAVATCRGAEAVCLPAVRSLALDETQLRALASMPRGGGGAGDRWYRLGRAVGMATVALGFAIWGIARLVKRRRSAKQS